MNRPLPWHLSRVALLLAWLLGSVGLLALVTPPVSAAPDEPGDLVVEADPTEPWWDDWAPGTSRFWQVDVALLGADRGSLSVRVTGSGSMVTADDAGLRIEIASCATPYVGGTATTAPTCVAGATTVVGETNLATVSSRVEAEAGTGPHLWTLADLETGRDRYFLVTLTRPATPGDRQDVEARFGVGFFSAGDTGAAGSEGQAAQIPSTGGPAMGWVVGGILVVLAGGLIMRRAR